jgi:tetraacyldisaccharide 4'-kinase
LILTRGYGQDESKELLDKLPEARFGIGKNRFRQAEKALQTQPSDVAIMDDGFQHWALKRDLDIVIVNVLNPFGNHSLLPRGILREPLESLKRVSLIVLNDVNLKSRKEVDALKAEIRAVVPACQFVEAFHEPIYFYRPNSRARVPIERLSGKKVTAFSGIGTPRSFQLLLNQIGVKTVRNFEFGDHYCFSKKDLEEIRQEKELSESSEIMTTEKDYFRSGELISKVFNPLVLKVRIRLFSGETLLHEHLERLLNTHSNG